MFKAVGANNSRRQQAAAWASLQAAALRWVLRILFQLHVQIIALANLRHKATHSAQTLMSQFRREGTSQTWLPKEAAVQTRVRLVVHHLLLQRAMPADLV